MSDNNEILSFPDTKLVRVNLLPETRIALILIHGRAQWEDKKKADWGDGYRGEDHLLVIEPSTHERARGNAGERSYARVKVLHEVTHARLYGRYDILREYYKGHSAQVNEFAKLRANSGVTRRYNNILEGYNAEIKATEELIATMTFGLVEPQQRADFLTLLKADVGKIPEYLSCALQQAKTISEQDLHLLKDVFTKPETVGATTNKIMNTLQEVPLVS